MPFIGRISGMTTMTYIISVIHGWNLIGGNCGTVLLYHEPKYSLLTSLSHASVSIGKWSDSRYTWLVSSSHRLAESHWKALQLCELVLREPPLYLIYYRKLCFLNVYLEFACFGRATSIQFTFSRRTPHFSWFPADLLGGICPKIS